MIYSTYARYHFMMKGSKQGHAETENNRKGYSNPSPGYALGVEDDWEKQLQLFTLFSLFQFLGTLF